MQDAIQDLRDLESGGGRFLLAGDARELGAAEDVPALLADLCGPLTPVTVTANETRARELAAAIAKRETGRERIVATDELADADPGDVAGCVVEPLDHAALRALRERADRDGFWLIVDETRTAHRLRPGLASAGIPGFHADLVVLGPSLAGGLDFGVVAGATATGLAVEPPPTPVTLQRAAATLRRLANEPIADALGAIGERIRTAFDSGCARETIDAALLGPPQLMRFSFRGQENAEGPLLEHHFGLELERTGLRPGRGYVMPSGAWHGDVLDTLLVGLDRAVARMRCLLIEHASWMCGEVPFVFPGADPAVADRGLAFYRFPKMGAVDLEPHDDDFRIRFHGGPLGEVTSSGFYLPTLFTGDFDLSCRYRVHTWHPGPDSACFGLFAQNLASSHRYYAQRMSDGSAPDAHRVLGSHANVVHQARPVTAREGELRVTRTGREISTWHREPDETEWTRLAVDADGTTDDVVFGAKIWSKIECGPIEVSVHGLRVAATMAAEQIPRLEHRPDPRGVYGK